MTAIDELIETIAKADSSSWDIADHVAAIPQKGEDGYRPLREIADEIYERLGVEWPPSTLSKYRAAAQAFPMRTLGRPDLGRRGRRWTRSLRTTRSTRSTPSNSSPGTGGLGSRRHSRRGRQVDCALCERADRLKWTGDPNLSHCRRCHQSWRRQTNAAHCVRCHTTFGSPSTSAKHDPEGPCLSPESLGFEPRSNDWGGTVWWPITQVGAS